MERIKDIYDTQIKSFLPYDILIQKFPGIQETLSLIEYSGLKASVPKLWKIILAQNITGEQTNHGLSLVPEKFKLSRFVYWYNTEQKAETQDPMITIWEHVLQRDLPASE